MSGSTGEGGASPFTPNEALVYAAMRAAQRPIKAYELLDELHDAGVRAPMTIYRALEGLQAKGYAQKIVSQNAYVGVDRSAERTVCAVVTCRRCGEVRLAPLTARRVRALFRDAEMAIDEVFIEAIGDCGDENCRGQAAP
ncbi:MAG: hypothetical protein ACFB00_05690 [Parvularculaceae bacterium]